MEVKADSVQIMVELHWEDLEDANVRYSGQDWVLTGDLEVLGSGDLLAFRARQMDDVSKETALLYFGIENPPASLNPGDLGDHFDSLEEAGDNYQVVVKMDESTYRYELRRIKYK